MSASANRRMFAAVPFSAWPACLLACALLGLAIGPLAIAGPTRGRRSQIDAGLTVHEWGTFTSIAGADGQPVVWLPVQFPGPPELPGFVDHYTAGPGKAIIRGTIRMETPVIYFYTAHETSLSVRVSFSKGLITEWYPRATRLQPSSPISVDALDQPHEDGSIAWDSVTVAPNLADDFPRENAGSHYYAARETAASPVAVRGPSGNQREKFLFYRGVSNVSLPLSAKVLPSGAIQFDNRTGQPIPTLILFERRGDKLGYHILNSPQDRTLLETPAVSGTFDSLRSDLENILVAQGLFRDEARAMVETWRDSWFEEGSRLFYIVPRSYVDSILPLSITPAPAQLTRVFVGRIELVTPATEQSIETALADHDLAAIRKYGRFLSPILDIIARKQRDPNRAQRLYDDLSATYSTNP
jgi:hypothetical protein